MTIKERFKELVRQKYFDVKFYEYSAAKTVQESLTVCFSAFLEPIEFNKCRTRVGAEVVLPPFNVEDMNYDYAQKELDNIDQNIKRKVLT